MSFDESEAAQVINLATRVQRVAEQADEGRFVESAAIQLREEPEPDLEQVVGEIHPGVQEIISQHLAGRLQTRLPSTEPKRLFYLLNEQARLFEDVEIAACEIYRGPNTQVYMSPKGKKMQLTTALGSGALAGLTTANFLGSEFGLFTTIATGLAAVVGLVVGVGIIETGELTAKLVDRYSRIGRKWAHDKQKKVNRLESEIDEVEKLLNAYDKTPKNGEPVLYKNDDGVYSLATVDNSDYKLNVVASHYDGLDPKHTMALTLTPEYAPVTSVTRIKPTSIVARFYPESSEKLEEYPDENVPLMIIERDGNVHVGYSWKGEIGGVNVFGVTGHPSHRPLYLFEQGRFAEHRMHTLVPRLRE